jgi:hypothetical protein
MNKLIRVFAYILMVVGGLIIIGGIIGGILMLVLRGSREFGHALPMVRMMGQGSALSSGFGGFLGGLMVSGYGMILYLLGDIAKLKLNPETESPAKPVRAREPKAVKK